MARARSSLGRSAAATVSLLLITSASTPARADTAARATDLLTAAIQTSERARALWTRGHELTKIPAHLTDIALQISEAAWLVRNDPLMQAWWKNLKALYRPTLQAGVYAGAQFDSAPYGALTAGASFDVTAPLCRFAGGQVDGLQYRDAEELALAYDTRATACLPLGPVSFEVGVLRQRRLRLGLATRPSLPGSRLDSDGFEMLVSMFRWREPQWEISAAPVDVVFRSYRFSGVADDVDAFQLDAAFVRYTRFGAGLRGRNRLIDVMGVRWNGVQDVQGERLSAVAVEFSPVRLESVRMAGVYVDAAVSLLQPQIDDLSLPAADNDIYNQFHFGAELALHREIDQVIAGVAYRRGLFPDVNFRILAEDRVEATVSTGDRALTTASVFAAHTRQRARPPTADDFSAAWTYDLSGEHERPLSGPLRLLLFGEVTRSYYANFERRLDRPRLELLVGVATGISWQTP